MLANAHVSRPREVDRRRRRRRRRPNAPESVVRVDYPRQRLRTAPLRLVEERPGPLGVQDLDRLAVDVVVGEVLRPRRRRPVRGASLVGPVRQERRLGRDLGERPEGGFASRRAAPPPVRRQARPRRGEGPPHFSATIFRCCPRTSSLVTRSGVVAPRGERVIFFRDWR